jgi:hypothetical protein
MKTCRSAFRQFLMLVVWSWASVLAAPSFAADLVVTRYFSGLWDQPKQENQGIVLQIIDHDVEVKKAVAYWFTYGDDLKSAWFIGIGQVEGPLVVLDLYTVSGIGFMEDALPDIDNVEPVGSLILSFHNCNHGTASYDIGEGELGSGEFEIRKLAGLYNSRCSGGISDDTPGDARPVQLEVGLEPAREGIDGKGKAKFWERADRSDFHVAAEGIPDGDYDIQVCGASVGTLAVAQGEGEKQYRSPAAEGKELLTFDPRDCLIELHDGAGAVLTSGDAVLAGKTGGSGNGGGNGNGNAPTEISVDLESTGVIEGAEGEAEFRSKNNGTEFEVEVEDLPAGLYPLQVGGTERGQIEVVADGDDTKGELRFSDPQIDGRALLDFDPRGQLIEVLSGTDVVLEVFFPDA